jgi:hypothetical protein
LIPAGREQAVGEDPAGVLPSGNAKAVMVQKFNGAAIAG